MDARLVLASEFCMPILPARNPSRTLLARLAGRRLFLAHTLRHTFAIHVGTPVHPYARLHCTFWHFRQTQSAAPWLFSTKSLCERIISIQVSTSMRCKRSPLGTCIKPAQAVSPRGGGDTNEPRLTSSMRCEGCWVSYRKDSVRATVGTKIRVFPLPSAEVPGISCNGLLLLNIQESCLLNPSRPKPGVNCGPPLHGLKRPKTPLHLDAPF